MATKDGRRSKGIEDTDVMRYERTRVGNGRQDRGLERGISRGTEFVSATLDAVEETFRLVCAVRR